MTRTDRAAMLVCAALFCLCTGYGGAAVHVLPEPLRAQIGWTLIAVCAAAAVTLTVLAVAAWASRGRHR